MHLSSGSSDARAQIYSVGGAIVLFVILVTWSHCNRTGSSSKPRILGREREM